jgi:FkbM family methyltransferase
MAAHAVGRKGKVFSFEPNPRTAEILKLNATITQMTDDACAIDVKEVALGNRNGEFNLMYMPNMSGGAYISNEPNAFRTEKGWANTQVLVRKWSEIFPSNFRPDLIKIDVEGHEVDVLHGVDDFINSNEGFSILMEASPDMWRGQGHDPMGFMKYLRRSGFEIKLVEHTGNVEKADDFEKLLNKLDYLSSSGEGFGHLLVEK